MENNRNNTGVTAGSAIKDKVVDLQHKAQDKAVDLQHKVKERGTAVADRAIEAIKAHPFAAVGIAFGIGYIVMRLVRR